MLKILLSLLACLPAIAECQLTLKPFVKEADSIFVYRITSAEAEKYLKLDSINTDAFVDRVTFGTYRAHFDYNQALPNGLYVSMHVADNKVVAKMIGKSGVAVHAFNDHHRVKLMVLDSIGNAVPGASIRMNGQLLPYNKISGTFTVKKKNPEDANLIVYTPFDTLYADLPLLDEPQSEISAQRKEQWRRTGLHRMLSVLFPKRYGAYTHYSRYGSGKFTSTTFFNQPKYRKTDTVKMKAYVYRKKKFYNKNLRPVLSWYYNGENKEVALPLIAAASPGTYLLEFPIGDSLPLDQDINLRFMTAGKKFAAQGRFKLEDYLLDDISKYAFRSEKEVYEPGDSIRFFTSATDANGLALLDTKTTLTASTSLIYDFPEDSVYVPDSLWKQEKPLATTGETTFAMSTKRLPKVDFNISANLKFTNSNNETQEKTITVSYMAARPHLVAKQSKDSITVDYLSNGRSTAMDGLVEFFKDDTIRRDVHFPLKMRIDPFASWYRFAPKSKSKEKVLFTSVIIDHYQVRMTSASYKDTVGFALINPYKVPVNYTVFDGERIVSQGAGTDSVLEWKKVAPPKRHILKVKWQYFWDGVAVEREDKIGLSYKTLDIDVKEMQTVFPGQSDSLKITVTDYRNKPTPGVNLTAFSYSNQYKDVRQPIVPSFARYRLKNTLDYGRFETEENEIYNRYALGLHRRWISRSGLDTALYYKMLFPNAVLDVASPIDDLSPQVSVQLSRSGVRTAYYLLYLNSQLAYYYAATDSQRNAHSIQPGFARIAIRLKDKIVTIDSIYLQPHFKHDLFIDLDHLPPHSRETKMPAEFTLGEKALIERSYWQLEGDANTNDAFVWQGSRLTRIGSGSYHLIGPFASGSPLIFFAPNRFDLSFPFEANYQYRLTKQIERLEKQSIFPAIPVKKPLPLLAEPVWIVGDTMETPPQISYKPAPATLSLVFTDNFDKNLKHPGHLQFNLKSDSIIRYLLVESTDGAGRFLTVDGGRRNIWSIPAGKYHMGMITSTGYMSESDTFAIVTGQTLCINFKTIHFIQDSTRLARFFPSALPREIAPFDPELQLAATGYTVAKPGMKYYSSGSTGLKGKIIDAHGNLGIPFATVKVVLAEVATTADINGVYSIMNLRPGNYAIEISAIGYLPKVFHLTVPENGQAELNARLSISSNALNEVVVVGYGVSRKRDLTGIINQPFDAPIPGSLQGKVAGIEIQDDSRFKKRDAASLGAGNPIYVIDGILYDAMPGNINPAFITHTEVLAGAEATAIYGARGSGGAIVITTGAKTERKTFRDYAFWKPLQFTDKAGKATIAVAYPDNVSGWQNYVVGMDRKQRTGISAGFVQSYKPLLAQLSAPAFLIAGDSTDIVGKALNYTSDDYNANTTFIVNGQDGTEQPVTLAAKASNIQHRRISTSGADSVAVAYALRTSTGYHDQEEKKVPVFPAGTLETNGIFRLLDHDTVLSFTAKPGSEFFLYAQNNTPDLFLSELDHLSQYPYFCMEQTASKLKGRLMEKQIRAAINKEFAGDRDIDFLLARLLKGQDFQGGWPWWAGGRSDLDITNYVVKVLLMVRQDPRVALPLRSALIGLQTQLPSLKRSDLVHTLLTLAEAHHEIDYETYLPKIYFDSLGTKEQWDVIRILQLLKKPHSGEMAKMMRKAVRGMLGEIHWGGDTWRWSDDATASTLQAFHVLQGEEGHDADLRGMLQYFLGRRTNGFWRNTVESASIVAELLPYALSKQSDFSKPTTLAVTGDSSFTISKFPFSLKSTTLARFNVQKQGGGITYLTMYQKHWNLSPVRVDSVYSVSTTFFQDGAPAAVLKGGEKATLRVHVEASKEAQYVMIEIPIPAGCTYAAKPQDDWDGHTEYLRNKVLMFREKLATGKHDYYINLEARYSGTFTLNPAKVELMYFPTFFGREEGRRIEIK